MSIDPELSIRNEQIEKEDIAAKERLDAQRKPMEERIDGEYREYIGELLRDLQKDFVVEDVNFYEAEEYCVILKNKNTGKLKSYAFESPITVILTPINHLDPNNAAVRTSELYNYLFEITKSEK